MTEQSQAGPRRTFDGLFAAVRGLGIERNRDDRWLAGVASGLANRFGIDPLLARGILIVLVFLGGIGVLAYLVAWALLPDRDGRILAESALSGDGHGIALLVVIGFALVSRLGSSWWVWLVLVPVGLLVWWGVQSTRAGKTPEQMSEEASRFAGRFAASFSGGAGATAQTSAPTATPGTAAPASAPPHGMGPGRTGGVPTARVVHRPRRRAGLLGLLLVAGLAVAAYGLGLVTTDRLGLTVRPELVGAGFAVGGAGLALVLIGLTGRRAGFATFLAAVLALGTIATASMPTFPAGGFGERAWSAGQQPAGGFTLTAGEATLSLADAAPGSRVTVALGAGQLNVTVPKGTTATFTTSVRAGQVVVKRADGSSTRNGGMEVAPDRTVSVGTGATAVAVDARLVVGEIRITEAGS